MRQQPARNGTPVIDVSYSMRSDTAGVDPDDLRTGSQTLWADHQLLWSKSASGTAGEPLAWHRDSKEVYLWHESDALGRFAVGYDTTATSHRGYSRFPVADLYNKLSPDRREHYHSVCSTIGAYLIFPLHTQSINQRRGSAPRYDRFDLTLECIRRYYGKEPQLPSPLSGVLRRNERFFDLFRDFTGYVEFFHLGDLLNPDGTVKLFLDNFTGDLTSNSLPREMEDYLT